MAKKYNELRKKMSAKSRAASQRKAKQMLAEMPLHELADPANNRHDSLGASSQAAHPPSINMNTGHIARRILAASEVLGYYGDCRTILDEGAVWEDLDAADMSNLVGKGRKVTREEFLALCESGVESAPKFADSAGRSYWYSADHHIAWIYDDDQDVHYFFGRL